MLFVGCRMYVLAATQGLGEPEPWVKTCMIIASLGMTLQFLLVLNLPLASKTSEETGVSFSDLAGENNDVHPKVNALSYRSVGDGVGLVKWLIYIAQGTCMAMIYGGVLGVA